MDTTEKHQETPQNRSLQKTWSLCLIIALSLKNVFTACVEMAVLGSILGSALCILPEDVSRVHLFSNLLLMLAASNLLQSLFGVQLSVMQSPSFLLLCPILFYLNTPSQECPIFGDLIAMGPHRRTLVWQSRMQLLHGCFLLMAAVQALASLRAIHMFLCRLIPPIALISCVVFIPVALLDTIVDKCSKSVFLSMGTFLLFPIIAYTFSCKLKLRFCDAQFNVCSYFAIPLTVSIVWSICFLLTWFDLLPSLSYVRTDNYSSVLDYVDYHYKHFFEWGFPTLSLSAAITIVPFVLITIPLSVENYKAANKIQGKTFLTSNLSRGLYMDALCYLLNIVLGGVTGFQISSESLQDIADTKIWNKTIVQLSSGILIVISMCTTLCAHITLIPEPLLGALLCILCVQQLIGCVKIMSTNVDLLKKRNLYIVGMSILMSMILILSRSLPHSHMSHLLLVVSIATILHHVTRDMESSTGHYGQVTIESRPTSPMPNDSLNDFMTGCKEATCGCLSCLV